MVLPVVRYGHPVLRQKGTRIPSVTPEILQLVADMLETMKAAHGVGLAAQQVAHALQLAVIDVRGVTDRPSQLWIDGHPASVDAFMPLVLINPQVTPVGKAVRGPEGCLSFPEIYGEIERPAEVEVVALNQRGESFHFKAGGLLARAVLHEVDHLNGILFIDRMDSVTRAEVKPDVDDLLAATKADLAKSR
jgi:peptide deformylase